MNNMYAPNKFLKEKNEKFWGVSHGRRLIHVEETFRRPHIMVTLENSL